MNLWKEIESPGQILRSRLEQLREKNPRFSLRAFAKLLAISPAFLSHVMSGRKTLSAETAEKIADKLKFSPLERKFFLMMQVWETASSELRAALLPKVESLLTKLNAQVVRPAGTLSKINWSHLLLLVSLEMKEGLSESDLKAYARFVGVEISKVKEWVADLVQAGFLEREGGAYRRTSRQLVLASATANKTLKRMHFDYLKRASDLVENRGPDERFSVTEFFRMAKEDVPEAREKISELLDDFSRQSIKRKTDGVVEFALHMNYFSEDEVFPEK